MPFADVSLPVQYEIARMSGHRLSGTTLARNRLLHPGRSERIERDPRMPRRVVEARPELACERLEQRAPDRREVRRRDAVVAVLRAERFERQCELVRPVELLDERAEHLQELSHLRGEI